MKAKLLKWLIVIIVLTGVAAAGWYYWQHQDQTPQYQTLEVTRGNITQVVTATGQLNPVTNVLVGCQISGTIAKLFADYNSPVTNGQIVAQIDASTYEANLHQAEGDLANAKAALELAQINQKRSQELLDGNLIPQSDFDQATANLHQAEATVIVKSAAAERARVDLERCTIYSPVDGVVISRSVDVGQTVAASLSAPTLFTIANDLTKMQIDANVAEADIGTVAPGQTVDFTVDAFPTRTFHGKVTQVRNSPITVQNVVTYDTVIEVGNPDFKLRPGMTANVSIIVAHVENAVKMPNAALRYRPPATSTPTEVSASNQHPPGGHGAGGRHAPKTVYVLNADDKSQAVTIKIGISDGVYSEVLEGLKEGDQIITGSFQTGTKSNQSARSPIGGMRRF